MLTREGEEAPMAMDDDLLSLHLDVDDLIADWPLSPHPHPHPLNLLPMTTTAAMAPSNVGQGKQSRRFRHMMRERERRERLSQSYVDLHSILPRNTKGDKNSIVRAATAYAVQLKEAKEALEKRREKLKATVGDLGMEVIKVSEVNTSSSAPVIELMIGGLARLKGMGVKAKSIHFCASDQELSAVVEVQNKVL